MSARTLIVNADDFGLTRGVSRGILAAHQDGIVTSTTVIVNRPIDPALIEELLASGLGVGLHLNLTYGPPVSNPVRVPSLVNAQGMFLRDPLDVARRASKDEARIELGHADRRLPRADRSLPDPPRHASSRRMPAADPRPGSRLRRGDQGSRAEPKRPRADGGPATQAPHAGPFRRRRRVRGLLVPRRACWSTCSPSRPA